MLQGTEGSAAGRRHMQERECMIVTKDDPLAGCESVTVDGVDLDRVIIRSGSQLAMRDIDEPGIRLEDLLGSKRFVGCDRDGDDKPVNQGGIHAGGLPPVFE